MIKNIISKKKMILSAIASTAIITLVIVYIVPVKCTPVTIVYDYTSDAVFGNKVRTCYSIYHKKFWTEEKQQQLEFVTGSSARLTWVNNQSGGSTGFFNSSSPANYEIIIHHLYPADFSVNANLMGASHNVFIGKVVSVTGNQDFVGNPATQYRVQVIENIKGELTDTVIVNQEGGIRDGVFYQGEEGGKMLVLGTTYLLATRYDAENDYYTLNSHLNASKLLSSDSAKSVVDLQALADQDEKVKSLEAAYPDEVLLDADVAHNNTRNEFKSLPADKKAAAQSRADTARASLAAQQSPPAVQ